MLTRTNTNASDRLHRTNSRNSTNTSYTARRSQAFQNSPGTQQGAEVAAAEAYRRALTLQSMEYRPSHHEGRQKKNHRTSEGSHLADARLGRRRSTVRDNKNRATPSDRATGQPSSVAQPAARSSMTRPRPFKDPTTTAQGSPTPRRKTTVPLTSLHFQDFSYETGPSRESLNVVKPAQESHNVKAREMQTDEDIMNTARDQCLREFQQPKLRERKSFFLGSLQKLRNRQDNTSGQSTFVVDTSVPPYNYAEDMPFGTLTESTTSVPQIDPAPHLGHISSSKNKQRIRSTSLKGRIMKIWRKTSSTSQKLPPQHVEARRLHHSIIGDNPAVIGTEHDFKRYAAITKEDNVPEPLSTSTGDSSRVTSWDNSTVGTRSALGRRTTSLQRTSSQHTLRQRASFFGRSVNNKLRKASKPELKDAEQSQGLFAALQNLIHQDQSSRQISGTSRCSGDALSSLPSQQRCASRSSSSASIALPMRAGTPDVVFDVDVMSPVVEQPSPRADVSSTRIRNNLTTQKVSNRMERHNNRWQTSLDSAYSRCKTEVNPYELTKPEKFDEQKSDKQDGLPHHIKIVQRQALSPSLYSQGTDGKASRTATPDRPTGTVITITGHEVQSYVISPSKKKPEMHADRSVKVSSEWRRWLSDELRGFHTTGVPLESNIEAENALQHSSEQKDSANLVSRETRKSSTTSAKNSLRTGKSCRQRSHSRQSSYMNDRYPMLDSSRNSSHQSVRSRSASQQTNRDEEGDGRVDTLCTGMRSHSALAIAAEIEEAIPVATSPAHTTRKPHSTTELRARFKSSLCNTSRPIDIQRKSALNPVSVITDETLQNITAGPYAMEGQAQAGTNLPHPDVERLPALSSSEWLAGSAIKQKSFSPGQRMTTGWLAYRHSCEGSPAFV